MGTAIDHVKSLAPPFVKQQVRNVRRGLRVVSGRTRLLLAGLRLMPDFLIIGAMRCGTTSLYRYLQQHPWVVASEVKELHFFDIYFSKGVNWYRLHFPSVPYRFYVEKVQGRALITGEASPYYMFHPHVPRRVFEAIPRAKLVVLLRNPVDRAYSHYHYEVKHGREPLSFEEAIEAEPERLDGELQRILEDENYESFHYGHHAYLARGIYVDQLMAWGRYFPGEQILVLNSERFFADPSRTLNRVIEFLNLPDWEMEGYERHNVSRYQEPMSVTTRNRLAEYYAPHNRRLYEYLGMEFDW